MNDLFRFVLIRPADRPAKDETNPLTASFLTDDLPWVRAKVLAESAIKAGKVLAPGEDIPDAATARAVVDLLRKGPQPASAVKKLIEERTGKSPKTFAEEKQFGEGVSKVSDTLVALKLTSNSAGRDAADLTAIARGLDAIARTANGIKTVGLRPLALPATLTSARQTELPIGKTKGTETSDDGAGEAGESTSDAEAKEQLAAIEEAIKTLSSVSVSEMQAATSETGQPGSSAPKSSGATAKTTAAAARRTVPAEGAGLSRHVGAYVTQPWKLSTAGIKSLSATVQSTLGAVGLDPTKETLSNMLNELHTRGLELSSKIEPVKAEDLDVAGEFVGSPESPMPNGYGEIQPTGIGDLLLVREQVKAYEGGEIAHTENVLQSESLSRETRRLERTETTLLQESETTKEEERDTQTTERSSLNQETQKTIQTEASLKAGLSVDAKYGPFVEVKANAEFATKSSQQEASQQASEYSKDIVARSVSKIVERVRQERVTTTLNEFEEKYTHGFDNTNGTHNISGIYQWLDQVIEAQIYNYGKRMLFDVTLPEPATEIMLQEASEKPTPQGISEPPPMTITAADITEGNYTYYAALYDATGIEAPPLPVKSFSKAFANVQESGKHEGTGTEAIAIDGGYEAQYALLTTDYVYEEGSSEVFFHVLIGSNRMDAASPGYVEMNNESGTVPVSFNAFGIESFAFTVEVFCRRTEQALETWRLKTFAAIEEAYVNKQTSYRQALSAAQAEAATAAYGRSPGLNAEVINAELRKQCLTLLTGQEFDAFGALELSSEGFAQPDLHRTAEQMPYVRFFEQAFEWEHITYTFHPYFWGWKQAWNKRMLLDDTDPHFAEFLRAGAARVVFPVRPGFEEAVLHYLETGEIWGGGPPPTINSELYLPIIKEIQEAEGAPGEEIAEGEPWPVVLPTTLVRLRPDSELPEWKQENGQWVAAN
jgi:hypothetical protein